MTSIESLDNYFRAKTGNKVLDLYPPTKVVAVFCVALVSFFSPTYFYGFVCAAICIILAAYCGKLKEFMNIFLKIFLFFVVLLIVVRTIFHWEGDTFHSIGPVHFYNEGLLLGLNLSSVILSFCAPLILFTAITEIEDLMIWLEGVGAPTEISYIVLSTFSLIPELSARARVIQDSQKSRGIETEGNLMGRAKAFFPTLGPLLLSSINEAEERSLALESRGFNYPGEKTRIKIISDTKTQKVLRVLMFVGAGLGVAGGIYIRWIM